MYIKVGGKVYDARVDMIMLFLTKADRENIQKMHKDAMVFAMGPKGSIGPHTEKDMTDFIDEVKYMTDPKH